jgi:hypothetical protein
MRRYSPWMNYSALTETEIVIEIMTGTMIGIMIKTVEV